LTCETAGQKGPTDAHPTLFSVAEQLTAHKNKRTHAYNAIKLHRFPLVSVRPGGATTLK